MSKLSRREFLGDSAGSIATLAALSTAGAPVAVAAPRFNKILLPPDSELPLRTAADELAEKTGAAVVHRSHTGAIGPGEIVLALGSDAGAYREAASKLPDPSADKEWELVQSAGGGLLIAGSAPRSVCRAALGWMANPTRETDRLSAYRFEERFTMWDNSMNQMYRFSKGFDRRSHTREIARLGHTGVEINRYADPGGYHVRHRKFPHDSYAWYLSYAPALDAFVESSLTKGVYPQAELAANLADLRSAAEIARSYGLKPGFVCYEPRCVAEDIFDRYPQLRGSRTDHPGRSLQPRYALDIANRRVLEHYAESLTSLMKEVPDLRYFVFWTQDSGSGMPFARRLYFGPNGSYLARSKTLGEMAGDFIGTLLEAGRKINPEFEVIMEIGWEYADEERREITAALPKGATLSHHMGGSLLRGEEWGSNETYVREDRGMDVEPYAALTVSAGWDAAPIIGVPAPSLLASKFPHLRRLNLPRIFTNGGLFSPPQCPFNINQELYTELIRGEVLDLDRFLSETAEHWCEGDARQARLLVRAWKTGDQALAGWPRLNWYHAGSGQTQGRWLTRPLVPDITLLDKRERAAWERALFTLPWDVARQNIVFEGGIRMYEDEDLDRAIRAYDEQMLPQLEKTVGLLDQALKSAARPVIEDQRDRYLGLLLRARTVRNLFDAQVAINNYVLKKGEQESQRRRLQKAIRAEIANTRDWIGLLRESKTNFFHLAAKEETPFLHKTPVEDLELKLEVMQAHINDEPGPYLKELTERYSERELLYYE
jgi:hypothetical protein